MRPSVPDGDLAAIIEAAVTEKLERLEARRFAKAKNPRKSVSESDIGPSSRHIPAAVKRIVRERDGGRCRYVDEQGRRCTARDRLEFHHRHPHGYGGDRSPENIRLMCPAHNQYLADHDYGKKAMARHRRSHGRASQAALILPNGDRVRLDDAAHSPVSSGTLPHVREHASSFLSSTGMKSQ
jgi:hypothetical protein